MVGRGLKIVKNDERYTKLPPSWLIGQNILDTYAGKQQSSSATVVYLSMSKFPPKRCTSLSSFLFSAIFSLLVPVAGFELSILG
jgi:hypothetical protein